MKFAAIAAIIGTVLADDIQEVTEVDFWQTMVDCFMWTYDGYNGRMLENFESVEDAEDYFRDCYDMFLEIEQNPLYYFPVQASAMVAAMATVSATAEVAT